MFLCGPTKQETELVWHLNNVGLDLRIKLPFLD